MLKVASSGLGRWDARLNRDDWGRSPWGHSREEIRCPAEGILGPVAECLGAAGCLEDMGRGAKDSGQVSSYMKSTLVETSVPRVEVDTWAGGDSPCPDLTGPS